MPCAAAVHNAARNDPYLEHHHPRYTPLNKVPDSAIKDTGLRFAAESDNNKFLNKPSPPPELRKRGGNKFTQ